MKVLQSSQPAGYIATLAIVISNNLTCLHKTIHAHRWHPPASTILLFLTRLSVGSKLSDMTYSKLIHQALRR